MDDDNGPASLPRDASLSQLNLSLVEDDPRRMLRQVDRSHSSSESSRRRHGGGGGGFSASHSTSLDADASTATAKSAASAASSVAGPSPTVNTKWALNQLSVMFYSPGPAASGSANSAARNNHHHNKSRLGNLSMMLPPSRGDEDLNASSTSSSSFVVPGGSALGALDDASYEHTQHVDDRKLPARNTGGGGGLAGGFTIFRDEDLDGSVGHDPSASTSVSEAPRPDVPSSFRPASGMAAASSKGHQPQGAVKSGGFEIYCDEFAEDEGEELEPRGGAPSDDSQDQQPVDERESVPAKPPSVGFTIYCDEEEQELDIGSTDNKASGSGSLVVPEAKFSPVRLPYDDGDTASYSEMGDLLADLQQDPTIAFSGDGRGWGKDGGNGDDGETADYELVQRLLRRQSDGTCRAS
jgi:hypothetical protein